MRKCKECGTEYDDRIPYCFRDGVSLGQNNEASKQSSRIMSTNFGDLVDPLDTMDTLDHISIDDFLDLGVSLDGFENTGLDNTMMMQRPSSASSTSRNNSTFPPAEDTYPHLDIDDFEEDADFGSKDVVAEQLDAGQWDLENTGEILPGDTLDLMVDLVVEDEVRKIAASTSESSNDLDNWDTSGSGFTAKREDLTKQIRESDFDQESFFENSSSTTQAVPKQPKSKNTLMMVGIVAMVIVGILVSTMGDDESPSKSVEKIPQPPVEQVNLVEEVVQEGDKDSDKEMDIADQEDALLHDNAQNSEEVLNVEPSDQNEIAEPEVNLDENQTKDGAVNPENNSSDDEQKNEPSNQTNQKIEDLRPQNPPKNTSESPTKPEGTQTVISNKTNITKNDSAKVDLPKNPSPKQDLAKQDLAKNEKKKPDSKTTVEPPKVEIKPQDASSTFGWGGDCSIKVNSNVSAAEVFLDGKKLGLVGKTLPVDCGQHQLEVRADGYQVGKRADGTVDVQSSNTNYTINLTAK